MIRFVLLLMTLSLRSGGGDGPISLCGMEATVDSLRVLVCNSASEPMELQGFKISSRRRPSAAESELIAAPFAVPSRSYAYLRLNFASPVYGKRGRLLYKRFYLFDPKGELVSRYRMGWRG